MFFCLVRSREVWQIFWGYPEPEFQVPVPMSWHQLTETSTFAFKSKGKLQISLNALKYTSKYKNIQLTVWPTCTGTNYKSANDRATQLDHQISSDISKQHLFQPTVRAFGSTKRSALRRKRPIFIGHKKGKHFEKDTQSKTGWISGATSRRHRSTQPTGITARSSYVYAIPSFSQSHRFLQSRQTLERHRQSPSTYK